MKDPLGEFGYVFTGPGFRVPSWTVSPWTRGGRVFTERCDHNSQILFIEQWLKARGYTNVELSGMVHWRRENMCDFVNAFDFANVRLQSSHFSLTIISQRIANFHPARLQHPQHPYRQHTSHRLLRQLRRHHPLRIDLQHPNSPRSLWQPNPLGLALLRRRLQTSHRLPHRGPLPHL